MIMPVPDHTREFTGTDYTTTLQYTKIAMNQKDTSCDLNSHPETPFILLRQLLNTTGLWPAPDQENISSYRSTIKALQYQNTLPLSYPSPR